MPAFMRGHKRRLKGQTLNQYSRYCKNCLTGYFDIADLEKHEVSCQIQQKLVFPASKSVLQFIDSGKTYPPSHIAFFDFEAILDDSESNSHVINQHRAMAYAFCILDSTGSVVCKQNYCGRDAASHFLKNLASAWRKVKEERKTYSMVLTPEAVIDFKHQTACQICKKNFQNTEDKHRHHDHTRPGPNNLGAL